MPTSKAKKNFPCLFLLTAIVVLVSVTPAFGQVVYEKKDLVFTQVFAGPSGGTDYMASIAVSNRGTLPYNGTLYLVTGDNLVWNPMVNGSVVTGGTVDVVIQPDDTEIFLITSNTFTVGYAQFESDDFSMDNYIEGNLTYLGMNNSTLMDAVGVPESKEFMVSSLPFDMYADVGLALVNPSNTTSQVRVILFDENGNFAATSDFNLAPGEHLSRYLTQLPWSSDPVGFGPVGKVEILTRNGVPISGIAMLITPGSAAGAQISTLPLGGTPITYEATFTGAGDVTYTGELALWIEGFGVKGYLQMTSVDGAGTPVDFNANTPIMLNGQLVGTELELASTTWPANTWPGVESPYGGILYIYIALYDPTADILDENSNTWASYHVWDTDQDIERGIVVLENTIF